MRAPVGAINNLKKDSIHKSHFETIHKMFPAYDYCHSLFSGKKSNLWWFQCRFESSLELSLGSSMNQKNIKIFRKVRFLEAVQGFTARYRSYYSLFVTSLLEILSGENPQIPIIYLSPSVILSHVTSSPQRKIFQFNGTEEGKITLW